MIIDQLLFFLIGIQSLAYQVLRITCILAVAVTSLGSLCCSFGPTQWSLNSHQEQDTGRGWQWCLGSLRGLLSGLRSSQHQIQHSAWEGEGVRREKRCRERQAPGVSISMLICQELGNCLMDSFAVTWILRRSETFFYQVDVLITSLLYMDVGGWLDFARRGLSESPVLGWAVMHKHVLYCLLSRGGSCQNLLSSNNPLLQTPGRSHWWC